MRKTYNTRPRRRLTPNRGELHRMALSSTDPTLRTSARNLSRHLLSEKLMEKDRVSTKVLIEQDGDLGTNRVRIVDKSASEFAEEFGKQHPLLLAQLSD